MLCVKQYWFAGAREGALTTTVVAILIGYALAAFVVASAFALGGVTRLLPGAHVSVGARLLLIPGAFLLWPLIVRRWITNDASAADTSEKEIKS